MKRKRILKSSHNGTSFDELSSRISNVEAALGKFVFRQILYTYAMEEKEKRCAVTNMVNLDVKYHIDEYKRQLSG